METTIFKSARLSIIRWNMIIDWSLKRQRKLIIGEINLYLFCFFTLTFIKHLYIKFWHTQTSRKAISRFDS